MKAIRFSRTALIFIDAPVEYLTANGEKSKEDGWKEIENRLIDHLRGFNPYRDDKVPNATFIDWEEAE